MTIAYAVIMETTPENWEVVSGTKKHFVWKKANVPNMEGLDIKDMVSQHLFFQLGSTCEFYYETSTPNNVHVWGTVLGFKHPF